MKAKIQASILVMLVSLYSFTGFTQYVALENTEVLFSLSNLGFRTVEGKFDKMKGDLKFNPENLNASSFSICIEVKSINTESEKRDEHLLKEDFFDASQYPEICFESTEINKSKDGFVTTGDLKMHGVTKKVMIPFQYIDGQLKGKFTINRKDYNVGSDYGNFMVGNEVEIEITCTLK